MRGLLLLALLQAASEVPVSPPPTVELPSVKGADVDLLERVRQVGLAVERLSGEKFDRPPVAVRVPADLCQVAATIRARSVLSEDRLAARGRAWAEIGLGAGGSPTALLEALARDLAGVCFDPAGNRLLVLPGMLLEENWTEGDEVVRSDLGFATGVDPDEPLVAHLLTHVRQHERAGGLPPLETTDAWLADAAWAEGEANLVAIRYLFEGLGLGEEVLAARLEPDEVLSGGLIPASLGDLLESERRLLEFTYFDGLVGAAERYRTGGAESLVRAMKERRTTRDILHPDRANRPAPFPDPEPPDLPGARLADEDSVGEQGIIVLVSLLTGKDNLGLQAGDGWAGDRLRRWERAQEPDAGVTDWVTRWDSEEAAGDFVYAYTRCLASRFPDAVLNGAADGSHSLQAGGRLFRLERQGREVRLRVRPHRKSDEP